MESNDLRFEECDTPEKLQELRAFAKTFDPPHTISDTKHRILIVKRDGEWIGYAEICTTPVVFTAWNKKRCKPRDIVEAMKAFVGWARIEHGQGLTAVPLNTTTFPETIMQKLGFYRLGTELYGVKTK